jgi:hypothetical protein
MVGVIGLLEHILAGDRIGDAMAELEKDKPVPLQELIR